MKTENLSITCVRSQLRSELLEEMQLRNQDYLNRYKKGLLSGSQFCALMDESHWFVALLVKSRERDRA